MDISRRALLAGTAGAAGAAVIASAAKPASAAELRGSARFTAGTTLEAAAAPVTTSGYTRLNAGPGYPLVVREDLAPAKPGREASRTGLAALVQLTDLHITDAQSPMRMEWADASASSAFRPHEALGTHGAARLVARINQLAGGPFTGRALDCVVTTGDSTDNQEHLELHWFLTALNGGTIVADSGDPARWEGVQTFESTQYYLPESATQDRYKQAGFPQLPGYFSRVRAPHTSEGLRTRWYSVFGNHDNSVIGVFPRWDVLVRTYTSDRKLMGFADAAAAAAARDAVSTGARTDLTDAARITREVTPDPRRKPVTPREFIQAHLDPAATGPGPVGHGFTQDSLDGDKGYYTFPIAPGVTGIAMDSTNRAGWTDGSLSDEQWHWLEGVLRRGSSTWYDALGITHRQSVTDELFVLFSHHTSDSMGNLALPLDGTGIRHAGFELRGMLHRYPNVIGWVNGHTHTNRLTPWHHADPRRSWWEINTASHVDFPQHARIVEVADNRDGTLSLFTTLIEADAPYTASYSSGAQADLASLYRELAYNDRQRRDAHLGTPADHNAELLLAHPQA